MRIIWDLPLSWLLLPLKVFAIFLIWIFNFFRNLFYKKNPKYWSGRVHATRSPYDVFLDLMTATPIYSDENHRLYCMRVPADLAPDGVNHNRDHSSSRQGLFVSVLRIAKSKAIDKATYSLMKHFHNGELRRGYHIVDGKEVNYSDQPVSGDMLCGFCFGYVHSNKTLMAPVMIELAHHLVKHKGLTTNGEVSIVANFQPGFQAKPSETPIPVGAQNLTYLAALRCGIDAYKYADSDLPKWKLHLEYWLRFLVYLDFVTIMFPTAGIYFRRGYFNENNCMMAAYAAHESSGWLDKLVYKFSLLFTWSASWPWLNGLFTGILQSATGIIPSSYIDRCRKYAQDFGDLYRSQEFKSQEQSAPARHFPLEPSSLAFGELIADEGHDYERFNGQLGDRSTLGQLAYIVWLWRGM